MAKYDTPNSQGRYQVGSNEQVLENKLGIINPEEMDEAELNLLGLLYQDVLLKHLPLGTMTVQHLKDWHRRWLGNLYDWAGEERSVNMSKDGFHFATVAQITRLLSVVEQKYLAIHTPCHNMDEESLIAAIAIIHIEFIVIHPFREGNGRLSRLLADVMAVQAHYEPLDYSTWDAQKAEYITAIHHGFNGNYEPMKRLVRQALHGIEEDEN